MSGTGAGWLAITAAAIVLLSGIRQVPGLPGLPADELVALLLLGAAALWLTGWAVQRARPSRREAVGALAMWLVFMATAGALYANREAAVARFREMIEEAGLGPAQTTVASGGDVTITRRWDGTFVIGTLVDGKPVDFMFDTGASAVVLMNETARRLGIDTETLRFTVPVLTANGQTLAARTMLDQVTIGPIGFARVPALVSAPGVLHQNLLGTTILERLDSYEVRGNRLVLRARTR